LAKYGKPWNMPRISSGFVDETSTLARYSPSIVLSWFDQKAMAIVYTLLALVIKNVRVGPTLPAFVSQKNWKFIQDNYGWMPIGDVDADLRAMLKN
jgi:hydroxylamine reductase (hybrid-cluster protein)